MWFLNPPVLREQFQTLISLLYLDWAVQWALRGTLQTMLSLYNPPVCRAFHHKNSPPFGDLHLMSVVWAAGRHLYQVKLFVGQRVTTGSPASPSLKKEQKHPRRVQKGKERSGMRRIFGQVWLIRKFRSLTECLCDRFLFLSLFCSVRFRPGEHLISLMPRTLSPPPFALIAPVSVETHNKCGWVVES